MSQQYWIIGGRQLISSLSAKNLATKFTTIYGRYSKMSPTAGGAIHDNRRRLCKSYNVYVFHDSPKLAKSG